MKILLEMTEEEIQKYSEKIEEEESDEWDYGDEIDMSGSTTPLT